MTQDASGTTQGMTIGTPSGTIPVNTAQEAKTLLMFVNQIAAPSSNSSHDNIGYIQLNTGDTMTPDTMRGMSSVHLHDGHNDHIPFNSASTLVLKGESYDWKLSTNGDGCQTTEAAWTFPLTLPSGASPSGWQSKPINDTWTASEDGFLIGYVEAFSGASQVVVTLTEPSGNQFQIAGASQLWGTDVYLPGNAFSIPIYNGCTVNISLQDREGNQISSGVVINAYWIGFGSTPVFEGPYAKLSVGETYLASSDFFLVGFAGATNDGGRLTLSATATSGGSSPTSVTLGASVNCGSNRWLQYNSFLLPVQNGSYCSSVSTGSGTPGVALYCLNVLTVK